MDASSTIDPSALLSSLSGKAASPASKNHTTQAQSRGLKRSRSPDLHASQIAPGTEGDDADDSKPRKRGRPPKQKGVDSPTMAMPLTPATPTSASLPPSKTPLAAQLSPTQSSPPRATPTATKPPAVKALPTVRDHTTDQLNEQGDEYLPREKDVDGENKVDENGYLVERQYRLRTFTVPNRGQRLFMLATECARVLNYRDSYLLFNKNRSLYKIIANQEEKDHLIASDVLPYSYRSRQIAIVTARSMFRQFGSRVIQNGRRVKDDYWEAKAIKQGFTADDAAGEKRPGAGRQREAAAAEQRAHTLASLPRGQVVYSSPIHGEEQPPVPQGIDPVTFATIPGISAFTTEPVLAQSFAQIPRPRQEVSGPAYEDQTRESGTSDVATHASTAAEYNKLMTQQRAGRESYFNNYWKRPHDAPPSPAQSAAGDVPGTTLPQQIQSPQPNTLPPTGSSHQMMMSHAQQQAQMAGQHGYMQQPAMLAHSPQRTMHQQLPQAHVQQASPGMSLPSVAGRQHTPSYNYAPGGMWPPPQPQPSPIQMPAYAQQPHQGQPIHSPMHPPSQLPRQQSVGGYPQLAGYAQMGRGLYQQPGTPAQQQVQQHQQHYAQHQQHHPQQHQQHGQQSQQQQQQQQQHAQSWSQQSPAMSTPDWQRGYQ